MARIWSEENRLKRMLEVEIALLRALAPKKSIPPAEISTVENLLRKSMVDAVKRGEAKSGHEVVSLIQAVSAQVSKQAPAVHRYFHYGLTSSDVLDTAFALQLVEAAALLLEGWKSVASKIRALARRHEGAWMAGRTHGVHAEPITFGAKLAGWHAEALRNEERLRRAKGLIAFGKASGAVGAFTQLTPDLERELCRALKLEPEPVSTQVVPRDRHADYFHALVLSAAAIERFAVEIRHLQKTEVLELEEPFSENQKGSSAMPHKRNPVLCENLCGLSRMIRSYESAVVENVPLWHERDITHSSVERVVFPDACLLLDFMLHRFASVLDGLQVYPKRMRANLESSLGLIFSQRVLLRLIDRGLGRLEAYDAVQRCAMKAFKRREPLLGVLLADKTVARSLSPKELRECFELSGYKKAVQDILKRGGVL